MDFPGEVSELLEVEVVLEVDVNWSQFLCHITLLVSADQLQCKAITYRNIHSLVTMGSTANLMWQMLKITYLLVQGCMPVYQARPSLTLQKVRDGRWTTCRQKCTTNFFALDVLHVVLFCYSLQ